MPPGTDAAGLVGDPEAARELFNPVFGQIAGGPSVIDIGANSLTPFFDWAEHAALPDMLSVDGVVATFAFVAAPNPDALVNAVNAYERAYALFGDAAHYACIRNDCDGTGFGQFNDLEIRAYLDQAHKYGRMKVIDLPHCDCRLARWASSRDKLPIDAFADFETAAQDLGLTRPARQQQWKWLTDWVARARQALAPLVPDSQP